MKSTAAPLLAALALAPCAAAAPTPAREKVESRMLVRGTIDVDADGRVAGYALHEPGALPQGIKDMVARNAPGWRFTPEPGAPRARLAMSLAFVAAQRGDAGFSVELRNANFSDRARAVPKTKEGRRLPGYPARLQELRVPGTVYLAVEIRRDGTVARAQPGCIDLRRLGHENEMKRWRSLLATATTDAIREWTFEVPPGAVAAGRDTVVVIMPVDFAFASGPRAYGSWETYVPGPIAAIDWVGAPADACPRARSDALPDSAEGGRRLLTPIGGGEAPAAAPAP